jgi:hypothetical protein
MSVCIGIDPGNEGGIAVMDTDGRVVRTWRMPTLKGKHETLDLSAMGVILTRTKPNSIYNDVVLLCVEKIQMGIRKVNPATMSGLFRAVGEIHGIAHMMRLPYEEVSPLTWQKLLVGVPKVKLEKGATEAQKTAARKAWKQEITHAARRRWPTADLIGSTHPSAKESSGISDALWIAEYARLRVMGGVKITA